MLTVAWFDTMSSWKRTKKVDQEAEKLSNMAALCCCWCGGGHQTRRRMFTDNFLSHFLSTWRYSTAHRFLFFLGRRLVESKQRKRRWRCVRFILFRSSIGEDASLWPTRPCSYIGRAGNEDGYSRMTQRIAASRSWIFFYINQLALMAFF